MTVPIRATDGYLHTYHIANYHPWLYFLDSKIIPNVSEINALGVIGTNSVITFANSIIGQHYIMQTAHAVISNNIMNSISSIVISNQISRQFATNVITNQIGRKISNPINSNQIINNNHAMSVLSNSG